MKKIALLFSLSIAFFLDANSATFTSVSGTNDWNNSASWTRSGSDADGIPDGDDQVIIASGSTILVTTDNQASSTLQVNSGGTLTLSGVDKFTTNHWITINGAINGTLTGANHLYTIGSTNSYYVNGSGTMSITGDLKFVVNFTLSGVTISNTGSILIGYCSVKNNTSVSLTGGTANGLFSQSTWINNTNSSLSVEAVPMSTGVMQATANGNRITLGGNSSYSATKLVNLHDLVISGSGTKSLSATNTPTINGDLTINSGATFSQTFFQIILKGNIINNGTYNATASQNTVFSGTSNQTASGSGNTNLGNFILNNINGFTKSSGNFSVSGTITVSAGSINNNGGDFTLKANATRYARIAPISTGCASCGFTGDFIIERYLPSRSSITWADLSSPVSNSTMQDWDNELYMSYDYDTTNSIYPSVYYYDESNADFDSVNAATVLAPGKGFELYLTDDENLTSFTATTLNTIGTPNFGTQTINLSYTNNSGDPYPTGYDGENLIGNPFASAITLSAITKTNTLSTVDVYNNSTDSYQTLSGSAYIGPHQGFWAYALGAGASFTIPESAKNTNTSTGIRSMESEIEPYMQLTVSSADGSHMMAHTLKLATDADANDGWDLKDHPFRKSPNPKAPSITANSENFPLSISTFNSQHDEYTLPINVQVGVSGKYQINVSGIEFLNTDYNCVSLTDKKSGNSIDLSSMGNYTFFATNTDPKDRFELQLSKNGNCKSMNATMANSIEDQVLILPTVNGNSIAFNFTNTLNTTVSVTNLLGQSILQTFNVQANTQTIEVGIPEDFSGMYIVSIFNENGTISKKFVKK